MYTRVDHIYYLCVTRRCRQTNVNSFDVFIIFFHRFGEEKIFYDLEEYNLLVYYG